MTETLWLGLGVLLVGDLPVSAGSPPEAQISDGPLRARLSLPDASAGFYRGTRFDWSGIIRSLEYDIRIENRRLGAGVRITADRPLSRLSLWAIRAPLSIEPFIDMKIEPGREFTWRIQYEYHN